MLRKNKKERLYSVKPQNPSIMDPIVKASRLMTRNMNFNDLVSVIVEQSLDVTRSDLSVFYAYNHKDSEDPDLTILYKRGRWAVEEKLSRDASLIDFIEESGETVIALKREKVDHFPEIYLAEEMKSAIALPLFTPDSRIGILILNSRTGNFYNNFRFQFLDSLSKMGSGMLSNALLFSAMKESYKKIQSMERYQENIFSSMTNILITFDSDGNLSYANREAVETLQLDDEMYGLHFTTLFKGRLSKSVLDAIEKSISEGRQFLGIAGIYRNAKSAGDMDFKLNLSPLMGIRGKKLGTVAIMTDETREQELQKQMSVVTEERRQIKDMFARYLSKDLVNNLLNKPELVKPGGAEKRATVLFADIRGYTSFSEGKDPAYIIEILNEYFNEAVEKVINNKGYIDKFIGDCIMAAWGVPMVSEEEDAINAVTCALEIQNLINSGKRQFFKGLASNLKVGIGMHSGYLVAGNLGSSRRMDYTIIGDTVNVAARLEGVAKAGEVIITADTRAMLGDHFKVEERTPVQVKGKAKPIHIFNVIERKG
ncbi:adenylate/guanylate cyclase domain-containing protein [Spirochaeta isovalerica]|uniref:Class 3 adenylate cyclase n=1 Tax=Spirochaeta isovalerica TaxID=150 RepID=A0A841R6E9_9SPIO|nr:adenylate/guanylate cyclase domain-containing protein [Spirochaeta isovalerica]MBB6478747.1 class 3 adenylate cyclase [Spirochaeta isovalerica]